MTRPTIQLYDRTGQRKYLTRNERRRFLEAAKLIPLEKRAFCNVLLFSGCRISEALQLTRERIDAQDNVLVFRTLKRRDPNHQRAVPVPKWLIKELLKIKPEAESNRLWTFSRRTGWVTVKAAMSNACISGTQACPKGLRHGFGIACAENNVPISLIAQWLGHASIETTGIYLNAVGKEEHDFAKRTWTF